MPDIATSRSSTTKYLIAEDHEPFRNLLRRVLAGPDAEIVETSNGLDAVAAFESDHPDWAILDIEMPQLDGLAAARQIKSSHPTARIAIITQHDQELLRREAEQIGVQLFMPKNNIVHLKQTLQHLSQP